MQTIDNGLLLLTFDILTLQTTLSAPPYHTAQPAPFHHWWSLRSHGLFFGPPSAQFTTCRPVWPRIYPNCSRYSINFFRYRLKWEMLRLILLELDRFSAFVEALPYYYEV